MSRLPISTNVGRAQPVLALLVVTLLAAAAAGCDGDKHESLTKAQVIERGSAICDEGRDRVDRLPQPSEHPFAKGSSQAEQRQAREFLVGQADAFQSVHDGFQQLSAPEDGREQLDRFTALMGEAADQLSTASTAAPQQVEPRAEEAYSVFAEAGQSAGEYGFPEGTCGVGGNG